MSIEDFLLVASVCLVLVGGILLFAKYMEKFDDLVTEEFDPFHEDPYTGIRGRYVRKPQNKL